MPFPDTQNQRNGSAKDSFIHFQRTRALRALVLWKCMNLSLAKPISLILGVRKRSIYKSLLRGFSLAPLWSIKRGYFCKGRKLAAMLFLLGAVHKGYPTFKLVRGFAKIGYE